MAESTVQPQYLEYLSELDKRKSRDEKNKQLVGLISDLQQRAHDDLLHEAFDKKLLEFFESEWDHQFFVCTVLRKVSNKRRHDWSKDYYYIFVLAGKFGFQVKDEEYELKWAVEVDRHYFLEPHHPEYEKTGGVIHQLDIEEMAIDRLCRQAERNNGEIDMEGMNKYLPNFENKKEENLEMFERYVKSHAELVKRIYSEYLKPRGRPESVKTSGIRRFLSSFKRA